MLYLRPVQQLGGGQDTPYFSLAYFMGKLTGRVRQLISPVKENRLLVVPYVKEKHVIWQL